MLVVKSAYLQSVLLKRSLQPSVRKLIPECDSSFWHQKSLTPHPSLAMQGLSEWFEKFDVCCGFAALLWCSRSAVQLSFQRVPLWSIGPRFHAHVHTHDSKRWLYTKLKRAKEAAPLPSQLNSLNFQIQPSCGNWLYSTTSTIPRFNPQKKSCYLSHTASNPTFKVMNRDFVYPQWTCFLCVFVDSMDGGELFSRIQDRGDQAFTERGEGGEGASFDPH